MNATLAGRIILCIITALVLLVFYVPVGHDDYTGRWGDATYGVRIEGGTGNTITYVAPGSPAARAGIVAGDAVVRPSFSTTALALQSPRAGDKRTFTISHADGRRFDATMSAVPVDGFSTWDRLTGLLAMIPSTVFLIVACMLVFLRPSVMTWSFYVFSVGFFSTAPSFQFYSSLLPGPAFLVLSLVLTTVFGNISVVALIPFLMRFPSGKVVGVSYLADRAAWVGIAIAFALSVYEWYFNVLTGTTPPYAALLDDWLPLATFAIATAVLIKKVKRAPADVRQRIGFLAIGMVVSFLSYAIYFVPGIDNGIKQLINYGAVILPVSVAYAVLRHRVLDVNFVLNRALAYGILSGFVIAIVSLLDWFFGKVLSEYHLAGVAEIVATITIGFLLDRINKVIEGTVERIFFRHRREAEAFVKRAARALPYATDENAVADGLVQVPAESLKLSAAALYRRSQSGRFEGVATSNTTPVAPSGFDQNDMLVRVLRAEERPVWLDDVRSHIGAENSEIYVLAVPVTVRHQLVSFSIYGIHANGSQLDPDEVEMLEELAREAERAYDHIEAVRTRERYAGFTALPMPESV